jgi:hypothetical protein
VVTTDPHPHKTRILPSPVVQNRLTAMRPVSVFGCDDVTANSTVGFLSGFGSMAVLDRYSAKIRL